MVQLSNRRLLIGGKPTLVLSGEIHYFRLSRKDWSDRIKKAKEAGCNAVASYIPWIYHEEIQGDIDVTGRKRPERDIGAFIDRCKQEGLWFIARPGPFVMAEIKNEGIPDWIYEKYPDAIPTTWNGKKATSKNLNYLDPDFLKSAGRWYSTVMPVIAKRLEPSGGNVIAVQLDNEVGMLQCWTEADLSEQVLCEFAEWVQREHNHDELSKRYPFDIADPIARATNLRKGDFPTALQFHADYTGYTRDRFAKYIAKLREFAEKSDVKDVPFIVNIHGSGGGRATTFPIGISQNYPSYTLAAGYWGSSDHYLGDLTRQNAGDLYFLNAFMASVNRPEQPLSSIEFEAGTGDYGENGAMRYSGAATDFKARLSVVQGNRLLNHYLLAGGHNPMLEKSKLDGNSRVGTTGGRHGFAAPIGPEGQLDPVYFSLKDTNETLSAVGELLADMDEEHDDVALGFVPDYYSTDVKRPAPMQELAGKLESARGPLEGLTRVLMASNLSFPAVNLQAPIPAGTKAIALACSPCLHADVQRRLIDFVSSGGNLLLYGRIPTEDLEGNSAKQLADALGIELAPIQQGSSERFPSLNGVGWASVEPEVRVWQIQPFSAKSAEPFLQLVQSNLLGGAIIKFDAGRVAIISAEIPMHTSLWRGVLDRLGIKPAVTHDCAQGGVLLHRIKDSKGQRFISLINLDQEEKEFHVTERGHDLFGSKIFLAGRKAKLLPLDVQIGGLHVIRSTAEIVSRKDPGVGFRMGLEPEFLEFRGTVKVDGGKVVRTSKSQSLVSIDPGRGTAWVLPG